MSTTSTTSGMVGDQAVEDRSTQPCRIAPIALDGGWRGRIVDLARGEEVTPCLEDWRAWLLRLVDDPGQLPDYTALKQSRENEVLRARLGTDGRGPLVICKRSTPSGMMARLGLVVGRSRARRNFDWGILLGRVGIGTASPLAFIERRGGAESWLVTEYLDDVIDLDAIALTKLPHLNPTEARARKSAVIAAVARLFCDLEREKLHHRDLKATNILIRGWDAGGFGGCQSAPATQAMRAVLVDLDGLRVRARAAVRDRRQRLMRLAASLVDYPTITRTDYARFLRLLHLSERDGRECAGSADRRTEKDWKVEFRELAAAAGKYNRAASRRFDRKWA